MAAISFDAGSISAKLELDRTDFTAGLDAAKADADRFTSKPVKATITADGTQAKTTLDDLTARADKLSGKAGTIKIQADATQANAELDKTSAKADGLAAKNPTVKVTADASGANAELDKTALKADALGRKTETIKVNADTSDASKKADDLGKKISDLASGPFNALITAAVGFGPAAVPVLGAVTAAVLPLTAAIGSASVGLGAFGLLAKQALTGAYTAAQAVEKAQNTYNAAISSGAKQATAYAAEQKAISLAYAQMTPQQVTLAKQVGALSDAWQGVQQATTPLISGALLPWISSVTKLMQYLKPLVAPVAAVFRDWGIQLNTALAGNAGKIAAFTAAFAGRSADNIRNFGDALKFFAEGAGALIHDIAPSLGGASLGIARLAASFDGWAHSQKTADDIKGFFTWAKAEIPTVEKFLEDLAVTVGHLTQAMAYAGGGDLTVLTTVLSAVAALPPAAIVALADGYVALSLGLRAASGAMALWNGASAAAKVIQAALNTEVKATGAALVIQTVITLAQAAATAVMDAAETVYIALMIAADTVSAPLWLIIGAIVVAVAALAAGIYELATHWSTVWHAILAVVQDVWGWIKSNWPLLLAIFTGGLSEIVTHWSAAWGAVEGVFSAVIGWITDHWKLLLVILTGPIGAAALWIASHWSAITQSVSAVIDWISAHWKLLLVILTGPVGLAALWLIHAWAGIHNDIDSAWNAIAAFFTSWWNAEVAKFTAAGRAIESVLSAAWNAVSSAARAAWGAIAAFFVSWWNGEVAAFRGPVTAIENALKAAWTAITSAAKAAWAAIASFFTGWWNGQLAAFRSATAAIGTALSAAWNGIETTAKTVFGRISAFFSSFWGSLRSGFATAVAGVKTAWDAIESVVKAPVDWVIKNVYDNLIVRFWNDVAGPVGLPKLATLAEGGIVPGGYSRADNQLVWMRSGEGVLQPGAVAALGGAGFINWANAAFGDVPVSASSPGHYAGGGTAPVPGRAGALGATPVSGPALGPLSGIAHDVTGFLGGLVNDVKNGIYNAIASAGGAVIGAAAKLIPGTTGVAEAMREYPVKLWDGFAAWVTGHGPGPKAAGGLGAVPARSGPALAAQNYARSLLAQYGWAASQMAPLISLWNEESGWNAYAANPTSNARGIPQDINGWADYAPGDYANQVVWGLNYIRCMPLDAQILTRAGWKSSDEVKAGDETIGFDPASGESRWTRVTAVHYYDSAPLMRMSGTRIDLRSTPNHKWLTEKLIQRDDGNYRRFEFTETARIGTRHRIRLAAPHADEDGLPVSDTEAEMLGWLAGDGGIRYSLNNRGGKRNKIDVRIAQSKPQYVLELRALLADIPHSEYHQKSATCRDPLRIFRLRSLYARDLLARSGYERSPEAMVLAMSARQRRAFLDGLLKADGYKQRLRDGSFTWVLAQNEGPVLDAALLAGYLCGHYGHLTDSAGQKHVSLGSAFVKAPPRREECGTAPVWCPTTENGSWTARQSGQIFLTGNSRYGSPAAAWAFETSHTPNWYDNGGWLQPGASMVMNATGRPEPVLTGGQWDSLTSAVAGNDLGAKLDRIAALLASGPRATASGISEVLNGTAHTAAFQRRYPGNR